MGENLIDLFPMNSSMEEIKGVVTMIASSLGDGIDDLERLEVISLKGAMTNHIFQINWPTLNTEVNHKVLLRIYGDGVDLFFNRDDEIKTFESMSNHGYGPKLLGRFSNGRFEEFIHARTLSADDLRDSKTSALIAAKLKAFHNLEMPDPKNVLLWDRLRTWLKHAKDLASPSEREKYELESLEGEINMLEERLTSDDQEIGFCHNDLQYGNIMIDEETNDITIIDFEYSSFNPIAYDLANHFCEMAANYHSETPHVLDYTQYPGEEERRRFITIYLGSTGNAVSDEEEVEKLLNDAERFTLANHIFWGLWGIISGYVNKIEFDYMEYARQRFEQYWLRKSLLLLD